MSTQNRVIVAYQGADNQALWYVSGTFGRDGQISGRDFSLLLIFVAGLCVLLGTLPTFAAGSATRVADINTHQTNPAPAPTTRLHHSTWPHSAAQSSSAPTTASPAASCGKAMARLATLR
jgi:hypothetical protein